MPSERRGFLSWRGLISLLVVAGLALTAPGVAGGWSAAGSQDNSEVRALWVLRSSLASPASIAALVRSARDHGFNTLLVQVRGRGDAYYNGGSEPRAVELQRQSPDFDPLDTVLTAAHAAGLRVHAWVNLNLVASAVLLPAAREHLVNRHPEWLMVPRDMAVTLAGLPAGSPAYVARLARWTRTQPADVEGLYASPLVPGAVDHLVDVVRDIAKRYPVDGLHFDYARYPTANFDYSRGALAEFRATVRPRLDDGLRKQIDAREKANLFAYTEALPDDWRIFRVSRMTTLMRRLRAVVKAERPGALVSVATKPELRDAYDARFQDWGTWLQHGIVDVVCPMAYAPESARFTAQLEAARAAANGGTIWAGIGAYRLSPAQTVTNIRTARRLGASGVILFSYDSLSDPRLAVPNYLAQVARAAFSDPTPGPIPGGR
jgi:uncharacterized lipoprotein YddW (UPF0748 family)